MPQRLSRFPVTVSCLTGEHRAVIWPAISAKDGDNPDRPVVADAVRVEDGAGGSLVGTLQALEEDVIPPPQPMCARAISRRPGVARFLSDEPDGAIVQVATDNHEPMLRGVRKDEAKLVAPLVGADVSDGTQVG